jgi:hypothetical protein
MQIIIIVAVLTVVVLALAASGGRPRITQVTRTVRKGRDKDGDDA